MFPSRMQRILHSMLHKALLRGSPCILARHKESKGGGVYLLESSATLSASIVEDNQAQEEGGALYAKDSTISLVDTLLQDNTASLGGGVYLDASSLSCTGLVNDIDGIETMTSGGL